MGGQETNRLIYRRRQLNCNGSCYQLEHFAAGKTTFLNERLNLDKSNENFGQYLNQFKNK